MSAGLVKVGKCYSGVLSTSSHIRHPLYTRIALATSQALRRIGQTPAFQESIQNLGAPAPNDLSLSGLRHHFFIGRKDRLSAGLYLSDLDQEAEKFERARQLLSSPQTGIHRRVFWAIMGITTPSELSFLEEKLYAAMIARMSRIDRLIEETSVIKIADIQFDLIEERQDGQIVTFSRQLLRSEPDWAHIEDFFPLQEV
jgi:hypothetical protein